MIKFTKVILLIITLVGCSKPKWYRVACNKNTGGTAMTKKMLIDHLDSTGFRCNNNGAMINRIKNNKIIKILDRMEQE